MSTTDPPTLDDAPPRDVDMSTSLEHRIRSAFRRVGPGDIAAAAVVAVAVVAFFPPAFAPRWTPRALPYLAVAPIAVVSLVRLVRRRDRAAVAAAVFIGVAVLSALLSAAPARSLLPVYYRHESALAWTAAIGTWAFVRMRRSSGRRLVERAFVGAVVASVVVGVLQLAADVQSGSLALVSARASGLSLNPVYLGAVAAGALMWSVRRRLATNATLGVDPDAMVIAVSMVGVWISGSRIALLVVLAALAAATAVERAIMPMLMRVGPWLAAGLVGGELTRWFNRSVSGGSSVNTGERLGSDQVASGFGVRFEVWGFDLSAFGRRPLLGHGPGSHANAVQPHLTPDFVDRTDPDDLLNNWTDAHNVVIELLVSVGAIGLIAAVVFAFVAARIARGPAAWAAGAIATTWLLQPVSFVTLLPVLALLGAASPIGAEVPRPLTRSGRLAIVAAGIALSAWLVGADVLLERADERRTIDSGELAAAWWWHDPMSAREAAVLGLREAVVGGADDDREAVLDLIASMTDRDPELAFWWVQRGDIERIFDLDQRALDSYRRALDIQPWSPAAIDSLLELERDPEVVAELERRLAELESLRGDDPDAAPVGSVGPSGSIGASGASAHATPGTGR